MKATIKHDDINSISYNLENNEIEINFYLPYKANACLKFKVNNLETIITEHKSSIDDFPYNSDHDRAF
jgi:hypothetical protein